MESQQVCGRLGRGDMVMRKLKKSHGQTRSRPCMAWWMLIDVIFPVTFPLGISELKKKIPILGEIKLWILIFSHFFFSDHGSQFTFVFETVNKYQFKSPWLLSEATPNLLFREIPSEQYYILLWSLYWWSLSCWILLPMGITSLP